MTQASTRISDYADELVSVPRAHLRLELRQDEQGLKLMHEDNTLVECYLTQEGILAGSFIAQALGVKIPPLGESTVARVSTGVLYRVIGIAGLDFNEDASYILLERLLEEADLQRGSPSEDV